jgi:hypothetical protein
MQTERSLELRQQNSPDFNHLKYPYSYLYEYDLTPTQIIGEPKQNSIDFPSCITHYYWIHEGINDEVPWRALFRYEDKDGNYRYGFYIGECDYTGFDCRGSMNIYLSDSVEVLIEKAFTDEDYRLYIKDTE